MARRVLAYECRYCGRLFSRHRMAARHETSCLKNPNSINCLDCKHCDTEYKVKLSNGNTVIRPHCVLRDLRCSKAVSGNCNNFDSKE